MIRLPCTCGADDPREQLLQMSLADYSSTGSASRFWNPTGVCRMHTINQQDSQSPVTECQTECHCNKIASTRTLAPKTIIEFCQHDLGKLVCPADLDNTSSQIFEFDEAWIGESKYIFAKLLSGSSWSSVSWHKTQDMCLNTHTIKWSAINFAQIFFRVISLYILGEFRSDDFISWFSARNRAKPSEIWTFMNVN